MDSQESGFVGQSRSLVAPTPFSAGFPSSEKTANHPDWLRAFRIFPKHRHVGLDRPTQKESGLRNFKARSQP